MKELLFILSRPGITGDVPLTLQYNPDGWDETLVRYDRSNKYWGLFRSFTIPLKFVKDGALYLRDRFYNDGLTIAQVRLTIKRLNKITLEYYTAYVCDVDFSTFEDEKNFVSVTLVDDGLAALIKKNETTEYDLLVYDNEFKVNFVGGGGDQVFYYANISTVLDTLVNRMTGENGHVDTTIFNDYDNALALTSTFKPSQTTAYSLKTSFDKLFKSIRAVFGFGATIETVGNVEKLFFKPIEELFSNNIIAHFHDVTNFNLQLNTDLLFNTIKIGYPDAAENIYDANSYSTFYSPLGYFVYELDLSSDYRADLSVFNINSENQPDESEIFFVQLILSAGAYYATPGLVRKWGTVDTFQFFNAGISPRRLLDVHKSYLESCINNIRTVHFISGGNGNMDNETSFFGGEFQSEFSPMFAVKPVKMFIPYMVTITVPLSIDFNEIITLSSFGVVTFDYQGNTYSGFIKDVKVKLAGRGAVEFKLILAHDNDLTTLIR